MLISESYRQQNANLHKLPGYGRRGGRHASAILHLCEFLGVRSVLDYGCGKAGLAKALGGSIEVVNYDPCIPEYSNTRILSGVVCCTDVLEHVEPGCLDDVLADIYTLSERAAYIVVATKPDYSKLLPDGRNPHLIIKNADWWSHEIKKAMYAPVAMIRRSPQEVAFLMIKGLS